MVASSLPLTLDSGLHTAESVMPLVTTSLVVLPVSFDVQAALAGIGQLGTAAASLHKAATFSPIDVTGAITAVASLAATFNAPDWIVSSLQLISRVSDAASKFAVALTERRIPDAISSLFAVISVGANTGPWLNDAVRHLLSGKVGDAVAVLQPQLERSSLYASLSANLELSPLGDMYKADPAVFNQVVVALAAGNSLEALRSVTVAIGAPAWAHRALLKLLMADVRGAKSEVQIASGSASLEAYAKLTIQYALGSANLPQNVQTAVGAGVLAGNASAVMRGLTAYYKLPSWSADAVIALTGSSLTSQTGLGSLFGSPSSNLELLNDYEVQQLLPQALQVEYSAAVLAGDVQAVLALLARTAPSSTLAEATGMLCQTM